MASVGLPESAGPEPDVWSPGDGGPGGPSHAAELPRASRHRAARTYQSPRFTTRRPERWGGQMLARWGQESAGTAAEASLGTFTANVSGLETY